MKNVELVGGPLDGKKVSVPDAADEVTIPVRHVARPNGALAYKGVSYSVRKGSPKVFDFRGMR